MPKVFPFQALHYNTSTIPDLSDVIIPPYDTIGPEDEKKFLRKSPYNFAHVLLPRAGDETYEHASRLLRQWREKKIVAEDSSPSYYLYQQKFSLKGKQHVRQLLMCSVQLHRFSDGEVRPHEITHGKFKEDRLKILRSTRTNLSHVFGMVKDPDGTLATVFDRVQYDAPSLQATMDDQVAHAVWRIAPSKAKDLEDFFAVNPIYVVDGHHRYESALRYAEESGALGNLDRPESQMLFAIANLYDPALIILPTHRILKSLPSAVTQERIEEDFDLSPIEWDAAMEFTSAPKSTPEFILCLNGKAFTCSPRHWTDAEERYGKSLMRLGVVWSDYALLQELCGIEEKSRSQWIEYVKDSEIAWKARESATMAILHAPLSVEAVAHVADEGKSLPQKTTFFYPKVAAGLLLRSLD